MQKIKNKIVLVVILLTIVVISGIGINVKAERSWDNKAEKEGVLWEKEIELWGQAIADWDEKRNSLHEKYYQEMYDDRASYCNTFGDCWEERMFELVSIPADGIRQEIDKNRCGVNNDGLIFKDGSKWDCSNGGQSITFNEANGESWSSRNFGQVIEYKNSKGDYWESSNRGQVIKFEGVNGEKWKSSNYGQSVEHTDKDGKKWSGSDEDDISDMR